MRGRASGEEQWHPTLRKEREGWGIRTLVLARRRNPGLKSETWATHLTSGACSFDFDRAKRSGGFFLLLAFFGAGDAAGFETYDSPLTIAVAVDPGVTIPPADVTIAVFADQVRLGCDHRGIAVNPNFDVT